MNKKRLKLVLCGFLLVNIVFTLSSTLPKNTEASMQENAILGDWSGILDVGVMKIHLALHMQKNEEGKLCATLDNLTIKSLGNPIDVISLEKDLVQFEIMQANHSTVKFAGKLLNNEKEISGKMTQNGQEFLLTFEKGLKEIQEPKRPQNPIAPLPYQEKLVVYDNIKAGITISGTLTLPPSQGPFPAVLLIAGSGPHDRNEEIFGHKPFLVLADHLTRNGIAALRVDKRGCGKSTGDYKTATSLDFSEDVEAGIAYLKSLPDINPCQIGLIGHSEGGMIAPMVASKSPDVAFLVLAAGPAATGEEILYQQNALILKASGESEETIEELNSFRKQIFAILKKESDFEIANNQLQEMAQNYLSLPQEEQKAHVIALLNSAPKLFTPWFRYFLSFDPSTVLKQIKVPVLAINGELDLQVPSKQNLPIIDAALKAAGNTDFTTLELPKLNHLFQTCQTGHFGEYQTLEETISPSALQIISDWILERVTN